jgi:hypothetical protein
LQLSDQADASRLVFCVCCCPLLQRLQHTS